MVQMIGRVSRDLIQPFSHDFSQFWLKTSNYNFSYKMSIGSTSSPTGSPILLQEQVKSLGSGLEGGMELRKGE